MVHITCCPIWASLVLQYKPRDVQTRVLKNVELHYCNGRVVDS